MTAKRRCCAYGDCVKAIPEPLLYCRRHWHVVPVEVRRRVNRTFRRLARRYRSRSRAVAYQKARQAALEAVAA